MKRASIRTAMTLIGASAAACATLLDFPDRTADLGDGGGIGASSGLSGSGGASGLGAASGSGGLAAAAGAGTAGSDGAVPDAGDAQSDGDGEAAVEAGSPGWIICGPELCAANSDKVCCADPSTGEAGCKTANLCQKPSVKEMCDEAADCPTGYVCCAELVDGLGQAFATSCRAACAGVNTPVQICAVDSECKTSNECAFRKCLGGAHIYTCSSTSACP